MADFESGLSRAKRMETNQHKQGRSGSKVPTTMLKGDSNPTSKGGINRSTQRKGV